MAVKYVLDKVLPVKDEIVRVVLEERMGDINVVLIKEDGTRATVLGLRSTVAGLVSIRWSDIGLEAFDVHLGSSNRIVDAFKEDTK